MKSKTKYIYKNKINYAFWLNDLILFKTIFFPSKGLDP